MGMARIEKEKYWQEHLRLAREHKAGPTSYCRAAGISIKSLSYWRKRCERHRITKPDGRSAFIPIQILNPEIPAVRALERELPDAKWVADVILHLSVGLSGGHR